MKTFNDKQNKLLWVNYFNKQKETTNIFDFLKTKFSKNQYGSVLSMEEAIEKLNNWTSDDITKFVLPNSKSKPLGDHIYSKYFSENRKRLPEHDGKTFTFQVAYNEDNPKSPLGIALVSFDRYTQKNYLEYIVTNPKSTHKGNGNRLLNSLVQNPALYSNNTDNKNLYTFIRKDNLNSIGLFKKNGFTPIATSYADGIYDDFSDSQYIAYLHEKILDKSSSDLTLNM